MDRRATASTCEAVSSHILRRSEACVVDGFAAVDCEQGTVNAQVDRLVQGPDRAVGKQEEANLGMLTARLRKPISQINAFGVRPGDGTRRLTRRQAVDPRLTYQSRVHSSRQLADGVTVNPKVWTNVLKCTEKD